MRLSLSFALLFMTCLAFSQNSLSDRIFYGGGAGFSASSGQTSISIYPTVGYKLTQNLTAGVGLTYQYVSVKVTGRSNESLNNYGWSVFSRYSVIKNFFLHAEYERLSYQYFTNFSLEEKDRQGYDSFLVGGGYAESLGGKASFIVTALYNVLYDESDAIQPYSSPWVIRAGVGVGF